MDIKKIEQMGMEQGFSHVVLLDCDTIELKPEVRQMCAADTCHKYDKCWSCPPGCGSLEECEAKVRDAVRNVRSVLIRMLHADFRNRLSHRWRLTGCW